MHKKIGLFAMIFSSCFVSMQALCGALPENYQGMDAGDKLDLLWKNIDESRWEPLPEFNDGGWGSILKNLTAFFTLKKSFDHTSDEMPEGRVKIIHTYGSVGKISLITDEGEHPFTGMYRSGSSGLARLSLAANPQGASYTPGMAVKFLIDGQPSRNLHIMHRLEGQGDDWNFFAHTFSNRIAHPTTFILKVVERIFNMARSPANDLPVYHLAQVDAQGRVLGANDVVAPQRLFFRPAARLANKIAPESRVDVRVSLAEIEPGPLYDVYGEYEGKEYKIGVLQLESEFVASRYADKHLFFQHQR